MKSWQRIELWVVLIIGLGFMAIEAHEAKPCRASLASLKDESNVTPGPRRIVVLDTNILLIDPNFLKTSPDHIVIPDAVLRELDKQKHGRTSLAINAREAVRTFNELVGTDPNPEVLAKGITLADGRRLFFATPPNVSESLKIEINDDSIIATAKEFQRRANTDSELKENEVFLMTNDFNVRIRAVREGIKAQLLTHASKMGIQPETDSFQEPLFLVLDHEALTQLEAELKPQGPNDDPVARARIIAEKIGDQKLSQNQFVVLVPKGVNPENGTYLKMLFSDGFHEPKAEGDETPTYTNKANRWVFKYRHRPGHEPELLPLRVQDIRRFGDMGLFPRNLEQVQLMDQLMDPMVEMLTVVGKAGTGKTLIAVAAALRQGPSSVKAVVKMGTPKDGRPGSNRELYRRIIFARPTTLAGDSLGYLPGDLVEKLNQYFAPIEDNLEALAILREKGSLNVDNGVQSRNESASAKPVTEFIKSLLATERVKLEAIQYLRGRSIAGTFIVVDEAQNMTSDDAFLIGTRVSNGTKLVFVGDIGQIDDPKLTSVSNGLTEVARRMAGFWNVAHVTLKHGERSLLSAQFAERFGE